jgi:hypothetical protein
MKFWEELKLILRLMVNWPVCLGIRSTPGSREQLFFHRLLLKLYLYSCGFLIIRRPALSDERMGLYL